MLSCYCFFLFAISTYGSLSCRAWKAKRSEMQAIMLREKLLMLILTRCIFVEHRLIGSVASISVQQAAACGRRKDENGEKRREKREREERISLRAERSGVERQKDEISAMLFHKRERTEREMAGRGGLSLPEGTSLWFAG